MVSADTLNAETSLVLKVVEDSFDGFRDITLVIERVGSSPTGAIIKEGEKVLRACC
jgi:hypothetical protein